MPLQFQPIALGIILVVAVGTAVYTYFNTARTGPYSYSDAREPQDMPFSEPKTSSRPLPRRRRKCNTTICTICLDHSDKNFTTLSCTHSFHTHCIEAWFVKERTCPLCRATA